MNLKFGDIFLVKFHPGQGNELKKFRPAVIVNNKVQKIDSRYTIIAPLTTDLQVKNKNFEIEIIPSEAIDRPCLLLCWYLWTIDTNRLINKLGTLSEEEQKKLKESLSKFF